MRLIDADALIDKAKKEWVWEKDEEGKTVPIIRYKDIINAPTVDAKPNGHWASRIKIFECSECGFACVYPDANYCPWCGAKMDK